MIHLSTRFPSPPSGEAWLYGCGPSLDEAPGPDEDWPILAINEAVLVFPGAHGIAWDPAPVERIGRYCRAKPEQYLWPKMIVEYEVWEKSDWVQSDGYYYTRQDAVRMGARPGTASVAICLLAQAGASRIHLRGFDTFWDPDAPSDLSGSIQAILEALDGPGAAERRYHRRQPGQYREIGDAMRRVAENVGVELVR